MENIKNPLSERLLKSYRYILNYKKEFIAAALVVVGVGVFGVGYSFYMNSLQKRAHTSFVEALKYFDAKVLSADNMPDDIFNLDEHTFKTENEKWQKVAAVFQQSYEKNKSAGISPMFLAYASQAYLNLGNLTQAINVLQQAVKAMASSDVKTVYQIKLALMQIDSGIKSLLDEGLQSLKDLSLKQGEPLSDMILYRLGEYHWNIKNFDEAKNYWNQLVLKYGKSTENPSWWVELARPKLKLISSK